MRRPATSVTGMLPSASSSLISTTIAASLLKKQVAGLAFDVEVIAGMGLAGLAFDPVPEALGAGGVDEDQNVLVMELGDLFVNRNPAPGVGNRAVIRHNLDDDDALEFGHFAPAEGNAFGRHGHRLAG